MTTALAYLEFVSDATQQLLQGDWVTLSPTWMPACLVVCLLLSLNWLLRYGRAGVPLPRPEQGLLGLPHAVEQLTQVVESRLGSLEQRVQQLAEASSPPPLGSDGLSTVALAVDTVQDAMQQALKTKYQEWDPMNKLATLLKELLNKELADHVSNVKALVKSQPSGDYMAPVTTKLQQLLNLLEPAAKARETDAQQLGNVLQLQQTAGKVEQNRFSTLDSSVKNKIDTTYGEITGKLTTLGTDFRTLMNKHEEEHARLELLLTKLDGILGGLGPLPDKLYKQCDRIESLIRERTGSVQEDVNRLMGSQGQQHRDEVCLQKTHTRALESVQAVLADMGAAMSRPPVDSEGTTSLLGSVGALEETVQDLGKLLVEIKDKMTERLPTRAQPMGPPTGPGPHQDTGGATTVPSPSTGVMPTVVDLSSRLPLAPRPVQYGSQMSGLAAVTFSNGRTMLTPEEEFLGYPSPQMPGAFRRN